LDGEDGGDFNKLKDPGFGDLGLSSNIGSWEGGGGVDIGVAYISVANELRESSGLDGSW